MRELCVGKNQLIPVFSDLIFGINHIFQWYLSAKIKEKKTHLKNEIWSLKEGKNWNKFWVNLNSVKNRSALNSDSLFIIW